MKTAHPDIADDYFGQVGNVRPGHQVSKVLLTGVSGAPNNYRMSLGGGGDSGDWTTPRHRHPFDQFRYTISGDYVIGKNEVLPEGWVAYFPESAYYGPQVKKANLMVLTVQSGGVSGLGFYSLAERKQAYEALVTKGGKFEGGVYTWIDAEGRRHNLDAAEAIWRQYQGRDTGYPQSRYRDLVMMNPSAFNWVKDKDQPGVAHRRMGTFTEREIKVGFIRVEKNATVNFGGADAPELLFVTEGAVAHEGDLHPKWSGLGTEANEAPVKLSTPDGAELLHIKLPTF